MVFIVERRSISICFYRRKFDEIDFDLQYRCLSAYEKNRLFQVWYRWDLNGVKISPAPTYSHATANSPRKELIKPRWVASWCGVDGVESRASQEVHSHSTPLRENCQTRSLKDTRRVASASPGKLLTTTTTQIMSKTFIQNQYTNVGLTSYNPRFCMKQCMYVPWYGSSEMRKERTMMREWPGDEK